MKDVKLESNDTYRLRPSIKVGQVYVEVRDNDGGKALLQMNQEELQTFILLCMQHVIS